MEQVDILVAAGTVVTMDEERSLISPGAVAVRGDQIVAVGTEEEVTAAYQASEVLRCEEGLVIPGLVNTHTHMPMSLLRGLADDLRLDVWLYGYILPVEKQFVNPEFCYLGTLLSAAELIRSGVTCFADMYYFEEDIAWAAAQTGMRAVCGETLMKFPTPDAASYDDSLAYCRDFLERFRGHELIVPAPAPHSIYMTTPELLQRAVAMAQEFDVPLVTHVSETEAEVTEWVRERGVRPVLWMERQGILEAKVVAAHCVHVDEQEIAVLAKRGVGVAHNPTSNLKLASGIAPVGPMMDAGVNVGIGTDGCASNNNLDMFEEIHLAALLPKVELRSPTAVPASQAMAMATIVGARALHLDHLIGSIEVGKRADLVVVDLSEAHLVPRFNTTGQNVYSQIVYAARSSDVLHVLINGRVVLRDRELLTIDEETVLKEARQLARKINRFFVRREGDLLDKLVAIGELKQHETFEIQVKGRVTSVEVVKDGLKDAGIRIVRQTERNQYDSYFLFDDPSMGRIRYREDVVLAQDGTESPIYTLTLTGPAHEAEYPNCIVLTRARYTASANRSLRFYREYFQPSSEKEVVKHRQRYRVRYKGMDFAINIDEITRPKQKGHFAEIKSRTWSKEDALRKAGLLSELLNIIGASTDDLILNEYVDLV